MIKGKRFSLIAVALTMTALVALSACSGEKADIDVLTQTIIPKDKTAITILVKNAFSINTFEREIEEVFPQLDIIQVGNYTADMGTAEYEARMKNDDLTDIVMTWPLDVGNEYFSERLVDLSSMPLSGKYNTAMLDDISKDGKLYYLPGPSQVRGIVYNKTLFSEKSWKVPDDFDGFIELCQEIEASGMRSLQLGFANSEVLDTAFVGFGYADCYSKPENAQRINSFESGNGSFSDNFAPALSTFQRLIDAKVFQKSDLDASYSERERMLFNRECAMIEDSVLMARMGETFNGSTDEFAVMPFFNPNGGGDWARLYPVCYIGVNKHLTEPENKKKYKLVNEILEYISTPEGQEALSGDTGAMFSSLSGTLPPDIPEIEDLVPALSAGRFAVFPTLKNAQGALREGLAGMVSGTMTADEVVKIVDAENIKPQMKAFVISLGSAEKDFSLIETGNFITDAMRKEAECDIALFLDNGKDGRCNQKGVSGRFYSGALTLSDLKRVLPDLRQGESDELCKVTMTGEELIKTLEYSIPINNNQTGWFYYFSGLRMEYDVTAEPGSRIKNITDENGNDIDLAKEYSVAVMDGTVPEEILLSSEKIGKSITAVLEHTINVQKVISPSEDGRFKVAK